MKNLLMTAILAAVLVSITGGASGAAPMVEVVSIDVVPDPPAAGQPPRITAKVARSSAAVVLEPAMFNIVAVVKLPSHVTKSTMWKDQAFERGQAKDYRFSAAFDAQQPGEYRIEYNVYSADMRRRLATSARVFTVGAGAPSGEEKPAPAPVRKAEPRRSAAERNLFGIGIYGNALNPAGGVTLLLWPSDHVGLQASYTVGTFTTTEARLLARFDPLWGVRPYVGVGYVNVTKNEDVIGVSTDFSDSGVSGVVGAEVPLGRSLLGYVELSGASIDLEEIVTNGGQSVKATVDYAPVTIGVGIVYYFF